MQNHAEKISSNYITFQQIDLSTFWAIFGSFCQSTDLHPPVSSRAKIKKTTRVFSIEEMAWEKYF